jgi:hypothetical protein
MAANPLSKSITAGQLPELTAQLLAICQAEAASYTDRIDPKIVLARIKEAGAIVKKEPTLLELSPGPEVKEVFVVRSAALCARRPRRPGQRTRGPRQPVPAPTPAPAADLPQVGDTHGQFPDMINIIELTGYPGEDRIIIFNGGPPPPPPPWAAQLLRAGAAATRRTLAALPVHTHATQPVRAARSVATCS